MTATVYDFVKLDKSSITTLMTTIAPTTSTQLVPIVQGNAVMFIKIS